MGKEKVVFRQGNGGFGVGSFFFLNEGGGLRTRSSENRGQYGKRENLSVRMKNRI